MTQNKDHSSTQSLDVVIEQRLQGERHNESASLSCGDTLPARSRPNASDLQKRFDFRKRRAHAFMALTGILVLASAATWTPSWIRSKTPVPMKGSLAASEGPGTHGEPTQVTNESTQPGSERTGESQWHLLLGEETRAGIQPLIFTNDRGTVAVPVGYFQPASVEEVPISMLEQSLQDEIRTQWQQAGYQLTNQI